MTKPKQGNDEYPKFLPGPTGLGYFCLPPLEEWERRIAEKIKRPPKKDGR